MSNDKSFEMSMNRLEEIVKLLEKNDQSLDDTIKLFEEGLNLVKTCDLQLKDFEGRVEALSSKEDQHEF